jgi:hypothetical protein
VLADTTNSDIGGDALKIDKSGPAREASASFGASIIQGLIEFREAVKRNDALMPPSIYHPVVTCGAKISDEEFDRLLDDLPAGVSAPHLPNDFSRADIYTDHD